MASHGILPPGSWPNLRRPTGIPLLGVEGVTKHQVTSTEKFIVGKTFMNINVFLERIFTKVKIKDRSSIQIRHHQLDHCIHLSLSLD